ncbi:hypothetical protein ACVW0Y_002294 [Pseudomonas sp. TE3786]
MVHLKAFPRLQSLRPATLLLTTLLVGIPAVAQAFTVCGEGRIQQLEISSGGDYVALVRTEKQTGVAGLFGRTSLGLPATRIGYVDDGGFHERRMRLLDRMAFLRMAYALQQPVQIISNGGNCTATSDWFTIILCRTGDSSCG